VTLVFCDVTGSTAMGERLDSEAVRGVMSRYFDEARVAIERHGGTVEKYVGDAVMAAFGVPTAHEDDPVRAVRAAAEMRDAIARLSADLEAELGTGLAVRIGVNTGEVIVGDPSRGDDFASGDPVNVAARLEQNAPPGEVLLGPLTYELVRDAVHVEEVEPLSLKGKAEPFPAYRLIEVKSGEAGVRRTLETPLVGRDGELQQLISGFDHAVERGERKCIAVVGDAGIGKSRLAAAMIEAVGDRATVLEGRCLPYGEGITFWPVNEMVKSVAAIPDGCPAAEALERIQGLVTGPDARAVAERVGTALGLAAAPATIEELFLAIRRLFESIATGRPLLLVFDDLHWAEPALLDLIYYCARAEGDQSMILLSLARPHSSAGREAWPLGAEIVRVGALETSESERLIETVAGAELEPDLLVRVRSIAEGNALFLQELVRMLIDDGALKRTNGRMVATRPLTEITMPGTIDALLSARLDGLEQLERDGLGAASVIGQSFWVEALAELCGPSDDVESRLESLRRKGLVVEEAASAGAEPAYRFAHILIRDAAYKSLLKETRAGHHERLARWLQERFGPEHAEYQEILGYHFEQAYRYTTELRLEDDHARALAGEAATQLGAAGTRAYARGDAKAAGDLLERAVSLSREGDASRLELMLNLGVSLAEGGDAVRADAVLGEALAEAVKIGDRRIELNALIERAWIPLDTGVDQASMQDTIRLCEQVIPELDELGDDLGLARAWRLRSMDDFLGCRFAEADRIMRRGLVYAERAGDRREMNETLMGIGNGLCFGPIPTGEAIAQTERLLESAADDPDREARLLYGLPILYAMRGDFDRARELYARRQRSYEELGRTVRIASGSQVTGVVELLAGEPERAEEALRAGYDLLESIGYTMLLATVAHLLAAVVHVQGRAGEAERLTRIGEELATPHDLDARVGWRRVRALILAERGEAAEARALIEEAVRLVAATDHLNMRGEVFLASGKVLERAGRIDEAAQAVDRAISMFERKEDLVEAERARRFAAALASA
jgi:class 3 adenylate cyclase/ATP/maltotriose-dependent transcriptional regulator MalT